MRTRWKAAALILPLLAALGGCGGDVTAPDGPALRPHHDEILPEWPDDPSLPPDTVFGDTPYHGSGHGLLPGSTGEPGIILD